MRLDDDSAKEIKKRIEMMSTEYSGGLNLNMVLDQMEEKLRGWRADLKKDGVDKPK